MSTESNVHSFDGLLERPLPPRSLIASLLLRTQPPRMRGARLVQWCELFGIAEGTTRVALSRMVDRGELRARAGVYELAGRVSGRRDAQDWSLDPVLARWDGGWKIAAVTPRPRDASERTALRDAMRRMRYAELREGMWTRPDNLPRASAPVESWRVVEAQCSFWSGRPDDNPAVVAEALFAIGSWAERAHVLTDRLREATDTLKGPDDGSLAYGFVTGAAAVAHVRSDPLLPPDLGSGAAAGDELRRAYRRYETAFSRALRAWFQAR
jgi:phenylacetic acid degradation operon negative regulatory protein